MGCANLMIDIQTIRAATNGHHFSTQFVENFWGNVIRGSVRGIDHNFEVFERQVVGKGTFTKLDVTTCGIIQTASRSLVVPV